MMWLMEYILNICLNKSYVQNITDFRNVIYPCLILELENNSCQKLHDYKPNNILYAKEITKIVDSSSIKI